MGVYRVSGRLGRSDVSRAMAQEMHDITTLLHRAAGGDVSAADGLWTRVYDELKRIAHRELQHEHGNQTLSTTALVHETYFKFVDGPDVPVRDRRHFYALACRAMRRILVDRARYRNAEKRGAGRHNVSLHSGLAAAQARPDDLLALNDALDQLAAYSEQLSRVVECHFFGGLSLRETAEVLDTPLRTVEREWSRARAYLRRLLYPDPC